MKPAGTLVQLRKGASAQQQGPSGCREFAWFQVFRSYEIALRSELCQPATSFVVQAQSAAMSRYRKMAWIGLWIQSQTIAKAEVLRPWIFKCLAEVQGSVLKGAEGCLVECSSTRRFGLRAYAYSRHVE